MKYTSNFKLKQPEENEYYNVNDFNENVQTIDDELKKTQDTAKRHAEQHAADGADPITPAAIGAAPAGHSHTYSDVGAAPAELVTGIYSAATEGEIEQILTSVYAGLRDKSIGYITLYATTAGLSLGAGVWHVTLRRDDANYGTAIAVLYGTDCVHIRERSKAVRAAANEQGWESYWTPWDDNINSANFASYVTPASIGAALAGHTHTAADVGASRIETGSYTGTGTRGSSYKNKITFTGVPKAVFIAGYHPDILDNDASAITGMWINGIMVAGSNSHKITSTLNGNTLYWYTTWEDDLTASGRSQLNESGVVYNYIALI